MLNVYPKYPMARGKRGFSLIEVMIAVVVLATGLLSLASLQAALTRNAADSRARSQIAAFADLVSERQRSAGATGMQNVPSNSAWTSAELAAVAASAGVSDLAVNVTATHYTGTSGTFVVCDTTCAAGLADDKPQYKEVHTVVTWTDATGGARRFDMTSTVSPRTVGDSLTPLSTPTSGGDSDKKTPVVRTNIPSDDGIIPIAVGNNTDTAATNPKPKTSGSSVIRTSFEILTYKNEGSSALQQRRVETAIIGCKCANGSSFSSSNAQFATAQWPAYWNGTKYTIYEPSGGTAAPGSTAGKAAASGVVQDELCTECCRDHHDSSSASVVHFDPFSFASGSVAHSHYTRSGATFTAATGAVNYEEACRMIRVDGFWRTAADVNNSYFNLLATASDGDSFVPSTTAQTYYENMVVGYLDARFTNGSSGGYNTELGSATVAGLEAANSINLPATVTIDRTGDKKWSHARGLYIDYLEQDVIDAIATSKAKSDCSGSSASACVLPSVPFTTINLTELASYASESTQQVAVENNSFATSSLSTSGSQSPVRGKVFSGSSPSPSEQVDVTSIITKSNAGLAVVSPISEHDATQVQDLQVYQISGSAPPDGTGGDFFVSLDTSTYTFTNALGNLPIIAFTNSGDAGVSCDPDLAGVRDPSGVNTYKCTASRLGVDTTVTVKRFNYETTQIAYTNFSATCTRNQGQTVLSKVCSLSGTNRRQCGNWSVSAATPGGTLVGTGDDGADEYATYSFPALAADAQLSFSFASESPTTRNDGGAYTCTAGGNGQTVSCPTGSNAVIWADPCL